MKSKLVVLVCLAALVAAGCSSSKKSSNKTEGSTTTEASNGYGGGGYGGGSSSSSTAAPSGAAAVKVATVGKYGTILVAADGRTLYLFESDKGTTSSCAADPCKTVWPGYAGPASGGDGVQAGKLSTANGQVANQVVYNGHLLYEFSGDKAAGDVNGTSIPNWYPVSPAGDKVDKD